MLYTELTRKAMKVAYDAHHGKLDEAGTPYVFHPFHLAEQMPDETTVCIALLHDVVEDSSVTMEELEAQFPGEVTEAVRLLTHTETYGYEEYLDYIRRIRSNRDAVLVKIADIRHNMDEDRLAGVDVPQEKREWWRKKYSAALNLLGTAGD